MTIKLNQLGVKDHIVIYIVLYKVYIDIFNIPSESSGPILIELDMHDPYDKGFQSCTNWESVSPNGGGAQGAKHNNIS